MESLGTKLRRQRRRLGFTLDELAAKAGISKPYLSLIETGRVANPPSDEKLRRLERALGFRAGELVTQAHLHRTPRDVRAVLARLMQNRNGGASSARSGAEATAPANGAATVEATVAVIDPPGASGALATRRTVASTGGLDLDDAYLSGVLAELVDYHRGNVEALGATRAVPVINKVQAGYPTDFTDLSYPRGVADDYVGCPDVADPDAFAARVHGDSMMPKYREGDIVIFSPAAAFKDGDDCFVRFDDGQTTFKRVFVEPADPHAPTADPARQVLRLQPRNERYRPQVIPRDRVTGVYKAIYRYQRVDE